eukprot:2985575-Rhodomonas_salina.1
MMLPLAAYARRRATLTSPPSPRQGSMPLRVLHPPPLQGFPAPAWDPPSLKQMPNRDFHSGCQCTPTPGLLWQV